MKKKLLLSFLCMGTLALLPVVKVATVVNTSLDTINKNKMLKNNSTSSYDEMLTNWNNDRIRTKYTTTSKILSYSTRTPAKAYTEQELTERWDEKSGIEITQWPQANKDKPSPGNEYKEYITWYKDLVSRYSNNAPINQATTPEKWPMMTGTFLDWANNNNEIKKHPAADYQYGYDYHVTDDTKSVKKEFNIDLNEYGYITTGLFLPPGEKLTIKFENITQDQLKQLDLMVVFGESDISTVKINGDSPENYSAASNWFKRMPTLAASKHISTLELTYGTPMGGIVNILNRTNLSRTDLRSVKFTIEGAVEALHYVHGQTTEADWLSQVKRLISTTDENKITAPIADLSTDHIKFLGPWQAVNVFKKDATGNYLNDPINAKWYPQKAMDWWDIMSLDGYYTVNDEGNNLQSVRMTTSNYVPAGEAVSFVRAFFVVQPWYWLGSILDLETLLKGSGVWGVLHEYNHQQQNNDWGFTGHGEVSNNAINLGSLTKYSNIFSDRSKFNENELFSHETKVNSLAQIYNSFSRAITSNSKNETRGGFDTDYSIVSSMFSPEIFQKTIRSYRNSNIRDFKNRSIQYPTSIVGDQFRNARMVYRISLITGYNWTDYYRKAAILTSNEENRLNNLSEIKELKKMLPVGSYYASKINYDNSSSNFYTSSTPFLIPKEYHETGYLFKKELMAYVPNLKSIKIADQQNKNDLIYNISNFKITQLPKFGTLKEINTENTLNNGYRYIPTSPTTNKYDTFAYSFDVDDKRGNKNTIEYMVEIQLDVFANFRLGSNLDYSFTNQDYIDIATLVSSRIDSKVNIIESVRKTQELNPGYTYWSTSNPDNWFNAKVGVIEAQTKNKELSSYLLNIELKEKVKINNFSFNLHQNFGDKQISSYEIHYLNNEGKMIKAYEKEINHTGTSFSSYFDNIIESNEFILKLNKNKELIDKQGTLRYQISDFSLKQTMYVKSSDYVLPISPNIELGAWTIDNTKGQFNNQSLTTNKANSALTIKNIEGNSLAIYGYKTINGSLISIKHNGTEISKLSTASDNNTNSPTPVLLGIVVLPTTKTPINLEISSESTTPVTISHFSTMNLSSNVNPDKPLENHFSDSNGVNVNIALIVTLSIVLAIVLAGTGYWYIKKKKNSKKIKK